MNTTKMFDKRGFSLVEVMVVVVIIGVLFLALNFISTNHIKMAALNEGKLLIDRVVAQERVYRARTGTFKAITTLTNNNDDIMVNAYDNKYFTKFRVTTSASGIVVTAQGLEKPVSGINITGTYTASDNSLSITDNM